MGKTVKFWYEWEGATCDTMYAKAKSCVKTRLCLSQFFCFKRWSVPGRKFVARFVFAVFERLESVCFYD